MEVAMSAGKGMRVTWLGHAAALVETAGGTRLLIDPFLSQNPSYPKEYVLPERIDFILVTHGHGDHTGDTVELSKRYGATVVAIFELASYLGRKGASKTMGMNLGGKVELGDAAVTMVEAKHSAGIDGKDGAIYAGVATGFVIAAKDGPVLYYAGDTAVFGDMKLIGELYRPELAMLPIGGYYTMGPQEAALAARLLGVTSVLPMHYGTFPILTGRPEQLARELGDSVKVLRVEPGAAVELAGAAH
jgi:L-ascorbate metabolism protein UlaG (beta-lactamase superfamily)